MNTRNYLKIKIKPLSLIGMLASISMILAACMTAATPTQAPVVSGPSNTQPGASTGQAVINLAIDPNLGKILVDDKGMTLYMFTKDGPDQSNCDASCLANWPALVTSGTPKVGPGVDASLIGTATLSSGEKIVTYAHMPLYYFIKDSKAGETSGEDVGSVWFVVSPDGKAVKPASSSAPTAAPAVAEPTIMVATDPTLGQILVDGKGMTLYAFTKDTPDKSTCIGSCLTNWPPLLTQGTPSLGIGVDDSKIGSALLADATRIVTYNHMPLYTFAKDTKPGDTSGQGVGSVWFVVNPDGEIIQSSSTNSPTAAPTAGMAEPTIMLATDPTLGQILVDDKGMTLYAFTKDTADKSTCTGGCLTNWPPLLTQGSPKLGTGVDDSKIGSALLADGTRIVTYYHMPLYYFAKDTKPGDTSGQGVGGVWFVVNSDGEIINK
jgi:predicted lipoprotein with Yx(FWY)xxD motif